MKLVTCVELTNTLPHRWLVGGGEGKRGRLEAVVSSLPTLTLIIPIRMLTHNKKTLGMYACPIYLQVHTLC